MAQLDPKVTAYVEKAEAFAQPILAHWRKLVHDTCPHIVEAIKWGIPHFDYKGGFMLVMAAYKNHCSFSFLKGELMDDARFNGQADLKATQKFMGKITSMADLPTDADFIALIKKAMTVNESGVKSVIVVPEKADKPKKVIETPDYFIEKLATNPQAKQVFENASPSYRKDYLVWITDAKSEETRGKRMEQAIEWIAEGKRRFWQYDKK